MNITNLDFSLKGRALIEQGSDSLLGSDKWLTLGQLNSPYGIKGWLKVYSYTQPKENIFNYGCWCLSLNSRLQWVDISQWQQYGQGLIVKLSTINDREAAAKLTNAMIKIQANNLPGLAIDEFYWHQLEGLTVYNLQQVNLGQVTYLMETGANDVLVIRGGFDNKERLIPFLPEQVIKHVSLTERTILVDWDANF